MTEGEVIQAIELRDKGKTFVEISTIMGHVPDKISRYMRQYEVYGSSLWSLHPKPIDSHHTS